MCSISGFYKYNDDINHKQFSDYFEYTLQQSTERGKDAFGFCFINKEGQITKTVKDSKKYTDFIFKKEYLNSYFEDEPVQALLSNHRAMPTTEIDIQDIENDVQPYIGDRYVIVHNGVIANDKELIQKYNLHPKSDIDSSVLLELLEKKWNGKLNELKTLLSEEIKGSFALAIIDTHKNHLFLCTNYKPIFYAYNNTFDCLTFTSLPHFIKDDVFTSSVREVSPYSIIMFDGNKNVKTVSIYPENTKSKKKALVIGSAGLDSTTCLSWAIDKGYDVGVLHFQYQCKAEQKEVERISEICNYYKVPLTLFPITFFKDIIGGSSLYDPTVQITHSNDGISGAEYAYEWVPARNLVFMSIALSYAESHDFDYIILGGNLEESGAYPDNEYIFQKKFNDLIPNSVNLNKQIEILTPVANLMKKEIVELGLKLKTPYELTWSCYESGDKHCGKCGPCMMRKTAFLLNGEKDKVMI